MQTLLERPTEANSEGRFFPHYNSRFLDLFVHCTLFLRAGLSAQLNVQDTATSMLGRSRLVQYGYPAQASSCDFLRDFFTRATVLGRFGSRPSSVRPSSAYTCTHLGLHYMYARFECIYNTYICDIYIYICYPPEMSTFLVF